MNFDEFVQKQMDKDTGKLLHEFANERGDTLNILNDHIELEIRPIKWLESHKWPYDQKNGYKTYISLDEICVSYCAPDFWSGVGHIQFGKNEKYNSDHIIYFKSKGRWDKVERVVMKAKIQYEKDSRKKTIIQGNYIKGDYVDDRDTIVKDSVINRSNVGAGGDDKVAKLEKIANLKKEGLIGDDDYEKMKREIIG